MTRPRTPSLVMLALGAAALALSGCGDAHVFSLDPGHIDGDSTTADMCFEGAEAALVRYSSRCERTSTKELTAVVGEHLEFAPEAVETLDAPCGEGPNPAIEISVERESLLFDFTNVERPGRFPRADFEGYVIDLALRPENALLFAAVIDTEQTTVAIDQSDVHYEPDLIEVNFQDRAYDERSLVKIDLIFANLTHNTEEAQ